MNLAYFYQSLKAVKKEKILAFQVDITKAVCNVISHALFGQRFEYDDESQLMMVRALMDV